MHRDDDLLGQVYTRPGQEEDPERDRWEVVAAWTESGESRLKLRSLDSGEEVVLSRGHLREPWWRPASTSESPTIE